MTSAETQIRALLDSRSAAMGDKDIEWVMSLYSPDIVYFDLVPPLQYAGSSALRERFSDWFGRWTGPIGQELGDLKVIAGDTVAAAWMLIRASGTLRTGQDVDYWVRVSNGFQRSGDRWFITHEHVSLPVNMQTRTAVMDLAP
ncbi:YybH family protein [Mesorhizobium onobrychidis]|uniref:Nuclear transport factor 2 family protein n=1 Tax=Mesorhizobium onobrychidis TaxID=2775404 RepID=A0ABY5R3H5_9HYPH|nr:nuclear transport factor 2 family protein [Mesorhizobium onobrychidis]UVC17411.1 nuclear transport factor 2 family protein [Mesorhizobium onobrychidis]